MSGEEYLDPWTKPRAERLRKHLESQPWASYVMRCEPCDIVMVESPAGSLSHNRCPGCGSDVGGMRVTEFEAKMMETSGRYNGEHNYIDGYRWPFWVKGEDNGPQA
jgi:hypothetical protein